jgi:hypothetical protein
MCKVVGAIAERVASGAEPWGTPHAMPPLADEMTAHATRNRLFNARNCGILADAFGELSVSVMYARAGGALTNTRVPGDGGYVLVVRVFDRDTGRRAIINRVNAGQPLAYNRRKEA